MKEAKLMNCPFCGREAIVSQDSDGYYVTCKNDCVVQMKSYLEREAIKAWNTRVPMERILERLEEESVLSEEERDRAREQNPLQYERCDSYICAIDNAIEIVKEEGGIE